MVLSLSKRGFKRVCKARYEFLFGVVDIHQIAFYVAYYQGYYIDEGIRPAPMEYVNGPTEMLAFASGDLGAGYVGVVPALISKSKGTDFVMVGSANLEGSAIVAKPSIENPKDLNGKRLERLELEPSKTRFFFLEKDP
jgi:ABC-type nitrate/sulfonate/bicarbonate transport system substrate-binding protein